MANYNKSKLYFFKLPSSFFKRDEIEWLKTQNNGYKVIVIYQELIFETINKDGILARRIGDEIKAYSTEEIARLINEDIVDVENSLNILYKIGFIDIKESDEENPIYYIEESMDLTNQSISARKKELQRKGKTCPPDIELDEEVDNRDKSLDIISNNTEFINEEIDYNWNLYCQASEYAEKRFNRHLAIKEREMLKELISLYELKGVKLSIDEAVYRKKMSMGYVKGILENVEEWGKDDYA